MILHNKNKNAVIAGLTRNPRSIVKRLFMGLRVKPAMTAAFVLLFFTPVCAQQAVIKASLDSVQIMIGEQTRLHLEVAANKDVPLQLPFIRDTLMAGVEVLDISPLDTTDLGNNRMQIKYHYLITSFDSALYMLPPFRVVAASDTFYSNELALKVSTLPVDEASGRFYDIKDVMTPQFVLGDYATIILCLIAFYMLIVLIGYLIFRIRKNKPLFPFKKEEKIVLPPHVRAIQGLDAIKQEQLWQHGRDKEYHSRISDVVRTYIDGRFGMNAMEMTSGQILDTAKGVSDMDFVISQLKQLLQLSDLVKFAKHRPLPDENELSMMNARLFVENTIPVENNENNMTNEINKE